MVVTTARAGWAQRKPSQGTAGITSFEWGLCCLRHTPPNPPSSFFPLPHLSPPPLSSPLMSFNKTPHGSVAFSLPLCFSLAILLRDLWNSMHIVPIDRGYKELGLDYSLSHSSSNRNIHCESIGCPDEIFFAHISTSSTLSQQRRWSKEAKRPWFFIQGTSVMNGKICPCFDLKSGMGQGRKNHFRSKRV